MNERVPPSSAAAEKEPQPQGLFIAIEGSDASGKNTQTDLLIERLQTCQLEVSRLDFPRYDEESSFFVRRYLAGDYEAFGEVDARQASLFFALDRYDARAGILQAKEAGDIVVTNRFVASNLAHQGSKIEDSARRAEFFQWANELEFEILGIPRPDLNIVLDVPFEVAQKLLKQRNETDQTKPDLHEKSQRHQQISRQVYLELCQTFPEHFVRIDCCRDGRLLGIDEIHQLVWQTLQDRLDF